MASIPRSRLFNNSTPPRIYQLSVVKADLCSSKKAYFFGLFPSIFSRDLSMKFSFTPVLAVFNSFQLLICSHVKLVE